MSAEEIGWQSSLWEVANNNFPFTDVVPTSGKRADRASIGARCRKPQQQSPPSRNPCNISIFRFRFTFQKRKMRCPFMEHRKRSQAKWIRAGKISILVLSIFVLHSKPAQSCMDFQSVIRLTKKMTCRHTINS